MAGIINCTITGVIVERQPFRGFKMSGGGTKARGHEHLQNLFVPRAIADNLPAQRIQPCVESA